MYTVLLSFKGSFSCFGQTHGKVFGFFALESYLNPKQTGLLLFLSDGLRFQAPVGPSL